MLNADQKLALSVLEDAAEEKPICVRAHIYRGAADLVNDEAHRARLLTKALILEEADSKCRELNLK